MGSIKIAIVITIIFIILLINEFIHRLIRQKSSNNLSNGKNQVNPIR
jgi:hypothetical protein